MSVPEGMCCSCGSVSIERYVNVSDPQPHVEFVISYEQAGVDGSSLTFTTQHRFSEFLILHQLLTASKSMPYGLPEQFPSRKRLLHSDAVLEQRRRELEAYLQGLVEMCHPGIHPALCRSLPPRRSN